MSDYKYFDHTADIGVEISGRTKKELFANASRALFDILTETVSQKGRTSGAKKKRQRKLTVEGTDLPDLMINFLRELLYLFNGEGWVLTRCEITECGNRKIKAKLTGEPYKREKHLIKTEIKAVTYSGVKVEKLGTVWKARIIFDV